MLRLKIEHYKDILFIFILFVSIFCLNIPLARFEYLSPDACMYLNIGRNIFSGNGPIISYNYYQVWPGKYYPALPYMPPIYPVIAGFILWIFNLRAVISFNIFLLAVNCAIIYRLLRLCTGPLASLLIALILGFSRNAIYSSMYPWTEQLHLLILLFTLFLYVKKPKYIFLIGVLFAVSCLVRVAGSYNVLGFLVALVCIKGLSKEALKECIKFVFGFLIVLLFYEMICYFTYGSFYPEYIKWSRFWIRSHKVAGASYVLSLPVLRFNFPKDSIHTILSNSHSNMIEYIYNFKNIKFLIVPASLVFLFELFKKNRSIFFILFFLQGITSLCGYSFSGGGEALRYSLIPSIMLGITGLLSIKKILDILPTENIRKKSYAIFLVALFLFIPSQLKSYCKLRYYTSNTFPASRSQYIKDRNVIYEWIGSNSDKDDLIASNTGVDCFLFERPFVSFPIGRQLTKKNFKDFIKIYNPKFVVIRTKLATTKKAKTLLQKNGFIERKNTESFVLFETGRE